MKGKKPFNSQILNHEIVVPDPIVEFIETEEVCVGKSKKTQRKFAREVLKKLKTSEYNTVHPLSHEDFSLQDQIDAGVPLKEVPTAIYGTEISQKDLLDRVEAMIDNKTFKKDKE